MNRLNRVYLIRHGQVEGYENYPFYGHTDVDLTETGILQMEQVSKRLRLTEPVAIYASDLKRAVSGARIVACYHDVPLYLLPELREMYFGDWEGLVFSEIQERFSNELQRRQENLARFQAPGDGESLNDFSERIAQCFEHIITQHKGDDIVIVAHGGVNRVILCRALNLGVAKMFAFQQDYGCLNIIDYYHDSTVIRLVNG